MQHLPTVHWCGSFLSRSQICGGTGERKAAGIYLACAPGSFGNQARSPPEVVFVRLEAGGFLLGQFIRSALWSDDVSGKGGRWLQARIQGMLAGSFTSLPLLLHRPTAG